MANKDDYSDILHLPRPVSSRHKPMSRAARAVQFSPFAALTGYEGVIHEEERLTTPRPELSEEDRALLNQKLAILSDCQMARPLISARFFRPDREKSGGDLITVTAPLRDLDPAVGLLRFTTGETVALSDLVDLQGELFFPLDEAPPKTEQ